MGNPNTRRQLAQDAAAKPRPVVTAFPFTRLLDPSWDLDKKAARTTFLDEFKTTSPHTKVMNRIKAHQGSWIAEAACNMISQRIYSYVWSRDRQQRDSNDFIVTENKVVRNVKGYVVKRGLPRGLHADAGLLFVNKRISAGFAAHIYTVNTIQIEANFEPNGVAEYADLVESHMKSPSLNNFKKHARIINVPICFKNVLALIPEPYTTKALSSITRFLNACYLANKHASVRVTLVGNTASVTQAALDRAALPFYPMKFRAWRLFVKNARTKKSVKVSGHQLYMCDEAAIEARELAEMRRRKTLAQGKGKDVKKQVVKKQQDKKTQDKKKQENKPAQKEGEKKQVVGANYL